MASAETSAVRAVTIDGTALAAGVKDDLRERVAALKAAGIHPGLGTILVGANPGSLSYVAGKHRDCAEAGIESIRFLAPNAPSWKSGPRSVPGRGPRDTYG